MNLPSCFIALQSIATLILPSESAAIRNGLQEVIKGGCNETTHYLSTRGFCCELCQAGSRKVMDCESDTTGTFCTSCRTGEEYTDEPNSSNECKKCTVCYVNSEDTESRCTTRQDTRCRCRDGFQRAAPSDPCMDAKPAPDVAGAITGFVIGAAVLLILLLATVGLLLYRIHCKRFPWERSRCTRANTSLNMDEELLNETVTDDVTDKRKEEVGREREGTPTRGAVTSPDEAGRSVAPFTQILDQLKMNSLCSTIFCNDGVNMTVTDDVTDEGKEEAGLEREGTPTRGAVTSPDEAGRSVAPFTGSLDRLKMNSLCSNIFCYDEVNSIEDLIGKTIAQGREGNWRDVERELPELREWIGKTPSLFLHELKRRNVVTEEEYWRAFTISNAVKRVDSILLRIMIRGEGKRRKLLETLEQQRSRERHFLDMLKTSHLCSPTLNPNSAHRQLQISADLSTVTWTQVEQPYSNHREMFKQWEIVLCFETFTSGDHYWEVDVRVSKNCSIGVARESIPWKCQEKSGRLGWNEQSWAFIQWDSNYSARHGDQSIPYPEIKHLQRVGVRLDFNAGKLSFYNANTMELLHSFDDIPSGPLCPAMQVNSGSVAIYEAQSFKNLTVDESREDIQICDHFANSGDHRTNNTDAEKGDSEDALLGTTTEEPAVTRELIGRIPAMLHHELLVQGLITQYEFSEVNLKPSASDRVKFMIRRLNRKTRKKLQLRDILREHRENQEAFLKMRSESCTCSPTLNPNTAHRNLQISADFKTVRTSTRTQPYRNNLGRFSHYQVVICSEKFSSGRHYWEVDVRGCEKFNIGLTYDAIPRKGDDKACKIGFNEVSWSLKKRGNAYTAVHNETETKLSMRDAPKKVGVHLDWEAGVLSFYSADSMSLLHRYHGQFDRELYPAMAVLHKSLAICPLPYADARC
ncbi:uncharacterized protein LOC116956921 isoform X2 [Petromyzon marinus]|uniref:uncharacterized protein LOC116956921 isoform X2 n=1 Tax=Petromyzon marinus TaxID=7757 RepID=UPI003F717D59